MWLSSKSLDVLCLLILVFSLGVRSSLKYKLCLSPTAGMTEDVCKYRNEHVCLASFCYLNTRFFDCSVCYNCFPLLVTVFSQIRKFYFQRYSHFKFDGENEINFHVRLLYSLHNLSLAGVAITFLKIKIKVR